MASMISIPPGSSRNSGRIAHSLSRVMMSGGLGLFLDPGGLPLGLFTTSIVPSSPPPLPPAAAKSLLSGSGLSLFDMDLTPVPLLSSSCSSENWGSRVRC